VDEAGCITYKTGTGGAMKGEAFLGGMKEFGVVQWFKDAFGEFGTEVGEEPSSLIGLTHVGEIGPAGVGPWI